MENLDEDEDDKVTPLDIKENFNNYSLNGLMSLIVVLINAINDLTRDTEYFKMNWKKCEEEVVKLTMLVTELQETSQSLSVEKSTYVKNWIAEWNM